MLHCSDPHFNRSPVLFHTVSHVSVNTFVWIFLLALYPSLAPSRCHSQASEQDILKYVVKWGEQQLIKRMADRGKIIHSIITLSADPLIALMKLPTYHSPQNALKIKKKLTLINRSQHKVTSALFFYVIMCLNLINDVLLIWYEPANLFSHMSLAAGKVIFI